VKNGAPDVKDIWPKAEVVEIDSGHIQTFFQHAKTIRDTIIDVLDMTEKYYAENHSRAY
jgi:hypothetical protein